MRPIAIITAIYDGYDTLAPVIPQVDAHVEWICVTDKQIEDPVGWRVVVEPRPGQHPNVAAKRPKMLPWEYTDATYTIWVDASFRVTSERFAADIAFLLTRHRLVQFRHPWRDCVYDEAAASLELPKYEAQAAIIRKQMGHYRELNHPEHWGLWATGVIGRSRSMLDCAPGSGKQLQDHGGLWLRDCQEWSYQDQLSEAVRLRQVGLRPLDLPGDHLSNPWLFYQGSSRH